MKREQIVKATEELNKEFKLKINTGVKNGDLQEDFMQEFERILDSENQTLINKIPKLCVEVYEALVDEVESSPSDEGEILADDPEEQVEEPKPEPSKKPKAKKEEKPKAEKAKKEEKPKAEKAKKEEKPKAEKAKKEPSPEKKEVVPYNDQQEITLDNCPDDYESLMEQSKKLVLSSAMSFMLLGQRLAKIRDNSLYKDGGYSNFKEFIEAELKVGKSTVYNAIDMVTIFGVQSIGNQQINPSTLIQALPLLKTDNEVLSESKKKEIKNLILKEAKSKSEREMKDVVKDLKLKYGLIEEKKEVNKMDSAFNRLLSSIPEKILANDRKRIEKYIKLLTELLG